MTCLNCGQQGNWGSVGPKLQKRCKGPTSAAPRPTYVDEDPADPLQHLVGGERDVLVAAIAEASLKMTLTTIQLTEPLLKKQPPRMVRLNA
jgi:hypothetical protein